MECMVTTGIIKVNREVYVGSHNRLDILFFRDSLLFAKYQPSHPTGLNPWMSCTNPHLTAATRATYLEKRKDEENDCVS